MKSKDRDCQADLKNQQLEKNRLWMAIVPLGILINLGMETLTIHLKLPVYLDAIGTLLVTILAGIPAGIATGITASLLGGILINPMVPYYTGTIIALAIFGGLLARKGFFQSIPKTILTGILLGIIAGTVSAPVTVLLFGGVTGTGVDAITAVLLATGESIMKSVFLTNSITEPLDKTLQCLLVFWLIKSLPRNIRARFANIGYLERNL